MTPSSGPPPLPSPPRRGFLVGALRALAGLAALRARPARASQAPLPARPAPSAREIARLGEWLAQREPGRARSLAAEVEAALPAWLRLAGSERRVRAARRLLLDPSRIARDLDCGRILSVDGWVLARSEVALAVFAHGASQRGATEPEAARLPG
jgi:hypothetical protein